MKKKAAWVLLVMSVLVLAFTMRGVEAGAQPSDEGASNGRSGEFVVGIPKLTDSFAYFTTSNGYETFSMAQVYDTLMTKDKDGRNVPLLAEKVDISDDAKTYTFYLRKGVKFSDGKEMKASDVRYSIGELIKSAYTSWIYEPLIESVDTPDDHTVVLKLKNNSVSFLEYLSNPYYCAILSEEAAGKFGDKYGTSVETVVGTGPYKLEEWKLGEYFVFTANEDYYLGAPAIKKVRLKIISDVSAAIIALQTGEIHTFFDDIPGLFYGQVEKTENVRLVDFPSTILFSIFMNCREGMFTDRKMREAVAYAIDRGEELLVGAEGKGSTAGYPGNRAGYTEGDPGLKDVWPYEPDIEKARQLIKEAGNEGKSVVVKTYSTDPYPKLATIMQSALTEAGLDVKVLLMERSAFIDEVLGKGDFDIQVCRWAAAGKDIDEIMNGSLNTVSIGAPGNWSFYSNPEMDKLLNSAVAETDPEKRKSLYAEAIKIYTEDVPAIPLYYPNGSRAYSKAVKIEDSMVEYNKFYDYSWAD
ncbi:MAG: ABC transporter substrate-binding protein [Synergistaceae bacterium]|jgi:peptide/nickel transport system substrate-binding protein|nr:ABC transporter substrate-binding protein [Synergistaceae bacterium]